MDKQDSNKIRVISLESSIDRRESFADNNRHIDFCFFPAIDGTSLAPEMINDPETFTQPLQYSSGAYGCALSHLALWEKASAMNEPLTILEDDAVLRFDFTNRMQASISALPQGWDIILWGWNFDAPLSIKVLGNISPVVLLFDQAALRNGIDRFQLCDDDPHAYRLDQGFGTPAYTISPDGARKFKSICFPIRDFTLDTPANPSGVRNNGIDIVMNQIYGLTMAYACFPPLAITPNRSEESTIEK